MSNLVNESTQGGSTLTQQYVKQVLADAATSAEELAQVTSRTSYMRKLREAKYATALERRLTKEQILEGYLNIAYFGDGAYGVGTAARHYFNKDVADLSLAESALLAGIVQNPAAHDPTDNKHGSRVRRNTVLMRMNELGYINDDRYYVARGKPVKLDVTTPANGCHSATYPFFCQYVKQQLETDPVFGQTPEARQQRLYRGGMTIQTTLDPTKQDIAQDAVDGCTGPQQPCRCLLGHRRARDRPRGRDGPEPDLRQARTRPLRQDRSHPPGPPGLPARLQLQAVHARRCPRTRLRPGHQDDRPAGLRPGQHELPRCRFR